MNICKAQTSLLACPSRVGGDTSLLTQNRSRKITLRVKPQGCLRVPSTNPYTGPAMAHTPSRLLDYSLAKEQDTFVSKTTETAFAITVATQPVGKLPRRWVAECYKCFPRCQSAVQNSSATCCGRVSNHSKQGRGIVSTDSAVSTAACRAARIHKNLNSPRVSSLIR